METVFILNDPYKERPIIMKIKKHVLIIIVWFSAVTAASAATLYSRPDGTWSTTNGGANCSCTPGQNDNIIVNHNITITGNFVLNTGTLTINAGTLTVTGDLTFNNGSTVTVAQNAGIKVNGNFLNKNNSNDIKINGSLKVTGNFQNGTGSGAGAVITVGPNGSLSFSGSCSNPGTIIDNSGSYTGCSNGPLPVTWLFFQGTTNGNFVTLTWATATEKNASYFEIERSTDAINFYPLAKTNAKGNTEQAQEYTFEDKTPLSGRNYYRLKSVDLDGYTEYFDDIVTILFTAPEKKFSVYPNPYRNGSLSVQLSEISVTNATIRIMDEWGSMHYTTTTDNTLTQLSPPSLPSGLYIVEVSHAGRAYRQRIIIE